MYVSGGQFYVFIACVAFGGLVGMLFSVSRFIKQKIDNNYLRIVPDLVAFCISAVLYVLYSHLLCFPNFRVYMVIGVIVGISIYLKSFHIMLAKCVKKLYNLYDKLIKIFSKRKLTKDGRIEG